MKTNAVEILHGDCREVLDRLGEETIHCVVTSPPYWNQRDYGTEPLEWSEVRFSPIAGLPEVTVPRQVASLGRERDPWSYVGHLVDIFRKVRHVLRKDGTLWLNLGDFHSDGARGRLKAKNLYGMPWRVALALQADGWYLRMDNVWEKTSGLTESVKDRPSRCHEYVFLLSRSKSYFYDHIAVLEPYKTSAANYEKARAGIRRVREEGFRMASGDVHCGFRTPRNPLGKNRRSVWDMPAARFRGPHFSVMPEKLADICIRAGTSKHGCCVTCGAPWRRNGDGDWSASCSCGTDLTHCTVLDPFGGAGTVGVAALKAGTNAVLIELSRDNVALAMDRIRRKVRHHSIVNLIPEKREDVAVHAGARS